MDKGVESQDVLSVEHGIREKTAKIHAQYEFNANVVKYILAFLAVIILGYFLIQTLLDKRDSGSYDNLVITATVVDAFSGNAEAKQRLNSALLRSEKQLDRSKSFSQRMNRVTALLDADVEQPAVIDAVVATLVAAKEASPQIAIKAEPVVKPKPRPAPLPRVYLYSSPSEKGAVISSVKDLDSLNFIKRGNDWTKVTSTQGMPVWVSDAFVKPYGHGFVKITGGSVNARARADVVEGKILGRLQRGDVLRAIRDKDGWQLVWSPPSFVAWVKNSEMGKLKKAVSGDVEQE